MHSDASGQAAATKTCTNGTANGQGCRMDGAFGRPHSCAKFQTAHIRRECWKWDGSRPAGQLCAIGMKRRRRRSGGGRSFAAGLFIIVPRQCALPGSCVLPKPTASWGGRVVFTFGCWLVIVVFL